MIDDICIVKLKNAIFSGSSKANCCPDGFNFRFYKSTWPFTGSLICRAIEHFFFHGDLPTKAKTTNLVLIPRNTSLLLLTTYLLLFVTHFTKLL